MAKKKEKTYRVYTDISEQEYKTLQAIKKETRLSFADLLRSQVRTIVANQEQKQN